MLLCGPVMLSMVRIPAPFVMTPRMMRIRSLRTGVRRCLRILRSKRDQGRRRQQNGDQNLFHGMSPPTRIPLLARAYTNAGKCLDRVDANCAEKLTCCALPMPGGERTIDLGSSRCRAVLS